MVMARSKKPPTVLYGESMLTEQDIYLFKEGSHFRLYEHFGSHVRTVKELPGTHFTVWAPNAKQVSVIGDFNGWKPGAHSLSVRWDESGIWEGFIPGIMQGTVYKYHIQSQSNHYTAEKGDPYAFSWERPPKTASIVADLQYQWSDDTWMQKRHLHNRLEAPHAIYEVHIGSWRRNPEEGDRYLTYREMAPILADYVAEMGFTHVEFLPVTVHPFYGSWGYQTVGYFAPTNRYGSPQDFMFLVDYLHQRDIGVILDWVPSHFPADEHGLAYFDGTHLYEHQDIRKGYHPDWNSYIFNYGRHEVRNFLTSSALFWLEKYHIDGLRVDAVASMLYLDYSRKEGEWEPNAYGGRENLEAIYFLRRMNEEIFRSYPDVQMYAEESTAWPMVSQPTYVGGLGFGMKWNMGWMHDTLEYITKDPVHRKFHHNDLTFSILYAFTENFILALSHDEVVHGKGSLLGKMPGDDWQKFANLRLLYGYMYGHPGKKLLFMGGEFGQWSEWQHQGSLEWHLTQYDRHRHLQAWVRDLNLCYRREPALHECDFAVHGYEWIDIGDWENSIISFLRKGHSNTDVIIVVCNFTPVPRPDYHIGVPAGGFWKEILNSDGQDYWGSGIGNYGGVEAIPHSMHGRDWSIRITLPPLSVVFFKNTLDS